MAPLALVLLLAQALLVGLVSASTSARPLDCSAITETSNLDRYRDVCNVIHSYDSDITFSPTNRLDILEMCTCHLLRHPVVWQSMLTHEVESLFLAARRLVESREIKAEEVPRDHIMFQQSESGSNMYFWDRYNYVLRSIDIQNDGAEFGGEFMNHFAEIYYNPDSFKSPFKKQSFGMTINLQRLISGACQQLQANFEQYLTYFSNLKLLSGNPRFLYRIVSYDETLFKLFGVMNMCKFMSLTGTMI